MEVYKPLLHTYLRDRNQTHSMNIQVVCSVSVLMQLPNTQVQPKTELMRTNNRLSNVKLRPREWVVVKRV